MSDSIDFIQQKDMVYLSISSLGEQMRISYLKCGLISVAFVLGSCGGGDGGSSGSTGGNVGGGGSGGGTQNRAPNASAGLDATLEFSSESYTLDASGSSDPDGDNISYAWSISQQPQGSSSSLSDADSVSASFIPDMPGDYVFNLRVTDTGNLSDTDSVTISFTQASMKVFELAGGFADAEFDDVNNRVVIVLDSTLTIIEKDGTETNIPLPEPANVVSVSPDGNYAVVGHIEKISYIDLTATNLISTINVPMETTPDNVEFSDIVTDKDGFAHLFSSAQFPSTASVNLENGSVEQSVTATWQASVGKLHPDGKTIYSLGGKTAGQTTSVDRHRIIGTRTHNFSYDGDINADDAWVRFAICNDLWMGFDGSALTGCHNLIRTSNSAENDRKVIKQLGPDTTTIQHASASPFSRLWYVIDTGELNPTVDLGNTAINVYDTDSGNAQDPIALPGVGTGADVDWIAKYVFADGQSDSLHILAVNDLQAPTRYAMLLHPNSVSSIDESNLIPQAVTPRYVSSQVDELVALDGGQSLDPENSSLTYRWTLAEQPAGSAVSPSGLDSAVLEFTPSVAGVYLFELRVSDGSRESAISRSTVHVAGNGTDRLYRLDTGIIDAEYSKSLNALVYLSDQSQELVILSMDDFSRQRVGLPQQAHTVGVSPDGLFAAVSHDNLASLVDLSAGTLTDQQVTGIHFGDIVLDRNYIAHVSPRLFLFDEAFYEANDKIYSVDFTNNVTNEAGFAYKTTHMRMHPSLDVMYGTWLGLSFQDIAKWDLGAGQANFVSDSRYHSDFRIEFDLWISETGDRILTQGESIFTADSVAENDMEFVATLPEIRRLRWADHSAERNQWVATTKWTSIKEDEIDPTIDREYFIFDDSTFALQQRVEIEGIPTPTGTMPAAGQQVFYSDDGSEIFLVLSSDEVVDGAAIQIIE